MPAFSGLPSIAATTPAATSVLVKCFGAIDVRAKTAALRRLGSHLPVSAAAFFANRAAALLLLPPYSCLPACCLDSSSAFAKNGIAPWFPFLIACCYLALPVLQERALTVSGMRAAVTNVFVADGERDDGLADVVGVTTCISALFGLSLLPLPPLFFFFFFFFFSLGFSVYGKSCPRYRAFSCRYIQWKNMESPNTEWLALFTLAGSTKHNTAGAFLSPILKQSNGPRERGQNKFAQLQACIGLISNVGKFSN